MLQRLDGSRLRLRAFLFSIDVMPGEVRGMMATALQPRRLNVVIVAVRLLRAAVDDIVIMVLSMTPGLVLANRQPAVVRNVSGLIGAGVRVAQPLTVTRKLLLVRWARIAVELVRATRIPTLMLVSTGRTVRVVRILTF